MVLWDPEHRTSRNCGLDSGFQPFRTKLLATPVCGARGALEFKEVEKTNDPVVVQDAMDPEHP